MSAVLKRLALIGANGMLANKVSELCPAQYEIFPFDLPELDISDELSVKHHLGKLKPDVVVNCAAYTNVDGCESHQDLAFKVNGKGPANLAEYSRDAGAVLVHVSTDYVFDGQKNAPYTETDATNPQSIYGHSKLDGEKGILGSGLNRFFILRTSWLYGPGGKNFVETIARLAREREEIRVVDDQIGCPTYTHDLASAIFKLLETEEYGMFHFSNEGKCSWYDFSCKIFRHLSKEVNDFKVKHIVPIPTSEYPLPATRPAFSVFSKEKFKSATCSTVPGWEDGLTRYFAERKS